MSAAAPSLANAPDPSDVELVNAVIEGKPGAFDRFYTRHHRLIFHCIQARAGADDANDLFQSFFERLVERDFHILKVWQRSASLPVYLSRVIRNFVIDFHRARRKKEESVGGLTELDAFGEAENETITTSLLLRELRTIGIQVWAKLESRDRVLLCGKLHRDLSNEELADRFKLSAGTLRTALSRAQARLLDGLRMRAPEYFPAKV
jgi:RNA polymerase sigma factor (sigma-70 family)